MSREARQPKWRFPRWSSVNRFTRLLMSAKASTTASASGVASSGINGHPGYTHMSPTKYRSGVTFEHQHLQVRFVRQDQSCGGGTNRGTVSGRNRRLFPAKCVQWTLGCLGSFISSQYRHKPSILHRRGCVRLRPRLFGLVLGRVVSSDSIIFVFRRFSEIFARFNWGEHLVFSSRLYLTTGRPNVPLLLVR